MYCISLHRQLVVSWIYRNCSNGFEESDATPFPRLWITDLHNCSFYF